jgi:hypothetical protein
MNHRFAAAWLLLTAFPTAALPDDAAQGVRINQSIVVDPAEDEQAVQVVQNHKACIIERNSALPRNPISKVIVFGRHDENLISAVARLTYLERAKVFEATEAEIKCLGRLPSLRRLTFSLCAGVTDVALAEIAKSPRIEYIHFGRCEFSEKGIKELRRLKCLKDLDLYGMHFSDEMAQELAGFTALKSLNLSESAFSAKALRELGGLRSLTELKLCLTKISDPMAKELAGMDALESLDLRGATISDAGLMSLSKSGKLRTLSLDYATVHNEGARELIQLRELRHLSLIGCYDLTLETIQDLRSQMPNCEIIDPNGDS